MWHTRPPGGEVSGKTNRDTYRPVPFAVTSCGFPRRGRTVGEIMYSIGQPSANSSPRPKEDFDEEVCRPGGCREFLRCGGLSTGRDRRGRSDRRRGLEELEGPGLPSATQ